MKWKPTGAGVKVEQAVADEKYGDQNTDGSYSVRMFYDPMRKAGATDYDFYWSRLRRKNGALMYPPAKRKIMK